MATVSLGASSRQFVRTPDNAWFSPGPGYATMVQTGTRTATNYICPHPAWPQDPHYAMSRGWDESGLSFAITNQHGDVQNFGYFEYKYSTDSGILCARNLGFQLNSWVFPQGSMMLQFVAAWPLSARVFGEHGDDGSGEDCGWRGSVGCRGFGAGGWAG